MPAEILSNRVLIHPEQQDSFLKRLESLNKKASKFGLPTITVGQSVDTFWKRKTEVVNDEGNYLQWLVPASDEDMQQMLHPIVLKSITMDYPVIKLGDWQVVGKLEAIEGGNLQFSVTDALADKQKLIAIAQEKICCEHCQTNRQRNDGFLLKNAQTDEYKQVGSTCLEDFTGIDPAAALFLAQMSQFIRASEGDEFDKFAGPSMPKLINTRVFLAAVSDHTDRFGFTTRKKAAETGMPSTSDDVIAALLALRGEPEISATHYQKADRIREWAKGLEKFDSFTSNLRLLLAKDCISIDGKHLAIAAAAIPQYNRTLTQERTRQTSNHIGATGDKLTLDLTIQRINNFETQFGTSTIVTMADPHGNVIKWKTSACPQAIHEGEGRTFEGKFKVKEHGEWNDTKETSVTHLKVLSWRDQALQSTNEEEEALEPQPLTSYAHYYPASNADRVALEDWPGFIQPKGTDCMQILKAYAEDALASDDADKSGYFTEQLCINPHDFYMHFDYLSDLRSKIEAEKEALVKTAPQAPDSASPPQPLPTFQDDAPAPF